MKILITGVAGFIGFHLCRRVCGEGNEVVGVDSITSYYDPDLKYARLSELGISRSAAESEKAARSTKLEDFTFRRMAVEDEVGIARLFADHRFDRVIHLAAQAGVRYSIENPRVYIQANISGFLNILEGCRASRTNHLVFASSSSVYGLSQRTPFSEHDGSDHPVSLYAATKKSNEMMAHAYSHLFGIPSTGLRFFTVYGPWGRPDMAYFKFAKAIAEGTPIDLFNNGDMKRDFTYIDDAVEGMVRATENPPTSRTSWNPGKPDPADSSAPFRLYNIGNSRAEPLKNLVSALERCMRKRAALHNLPMQAGDVQNTEADVSRLERDSGWRPTTTLDVGVSRFVDWFEVFYRKGQGCSDR